MEFIENNSRDAFQRWVALQAASQNAFGDDLDEGVWTCLVVQLDTVANCFTYGLDQGSRHTSGCRPCCQTTRFQYDNLATLSRQGVSRSLRGIRVVFPAPGAACTTALGVRSRLAQSSGNMSSIGNLVMVADRVD